jgi:hypothetical protein
MKFIRLIGILVASFAVVRSALAQGCAQCYLAGDAAGPHAQKSLDIGILVLLLPSLLFFAGVVFLLIRRAHAATA